MPDNQSGRPSGRQRVDGGAGKNVSAHGPGMGTGPVGKADAYSQKPAGNGSSGGNRSGGGRGKLIIIAVIVLMALIGGGSGLSNLLGGSSDNVGNSQGQIQQSNLGYGSLLSSLGSFTGNGSYSDGWTGEDNRGVLNTSVDGSARAKRTVIKGDNTDTVTLMVYICGTDLESKNGMASNDMREMASASLSDKVNVIVYTGGCKNWKTNGISNSVNQIYKIEKGQLRLLDKNRGSGSMTSTETLTDFINYCKQNYPANRNELILWDHGGGTVSGFGYDEKYKTSGSMRIVNIAQAIKKAGVTFDFIGFDACLMATLETALVLEPYADYLIASEETEPGIGWYYTNWLSQLSKNTSIPTTQLGKAIIDDFISVCDQKCPGQKATLSMIDLAELFGTIDDSLSAFSSATVSKISGSGYTEVSKARADTKEFASSQKIDQIDLVHLALNLDSRESKNLAKTLLSAVKYNKTVSCVSNAYGVSAYFPYRSMNNVNNAVKQLDDIGFDSEYTNCVKKFATLEVTGQTAGGGSTSPFGSLFGSLTGTSSGNVSSGSVTDIIGSLLGGETAGSGMDIVSMLGGSGIFDRSISESDLINMVKENRIDNSSLVWIKEGDTSVLRLSEHDWSLVSNLQLNVLLDDGNGYIDLGLDNIFTWTDDGALIGTYDNYWVSLNNQPVAYYFIDTIEENEVSYTNGRIPVLLNGDRAELLVCFKDDSAYISGVRFIYADGETETVAKTEVSLKDGDVIQPICDRYDYNGNYDDTYYLGDPITVNGSIKVSDVTLDPNDGEPVAAYMLTDRFNMEHWTPPIDN